MLYFINVPCLQNLARDHHLVVMATRSILLTDGKSANASAAELRDPTCRDWQVDSRMDGTTSAVFHAVSAIACQCYVSAFFKLLGWA
jgi:hypothetical protein